MGLFDASELGEVAREAAGAVRAIDRNEGRVVRRLATQGAAIAKASAVTTARSWGRDYPPAIRMTPMGATTARFAPEGKAANWSFEDGSRNQPPHRNFAKTEDKIAPLLPSRAEDAAVESVPESWQ